MSSTRREFLKSSLGTATLLSLAPGVPLFLDRTARAAAPQRNAGETVLVVVQLAGGNDGLNTVVPHADDRYGRSRDTLRLPAAKLHKIDDLLGFHPELSAVSRLYKEGLLSIVQGVGYPNPDQSHFTAMRAWQTARPKEPHCQTGWVGRVVDATARPNEPDVPAVFVGQINQPFTLHAERSVVPTLRKLEDATLRTPPGADAEQHQQRLATAAAIAREGHENRLLDFVARSATAAYATSRQIEAAAKQLGGQAREYPPFQFAGHLRTVAQLIRAELGIRIFHVELGGEEPGGFDNHANQRDNHAALLRQFSESLAAFLDDLRRDKLLDRVLVATYSEFGRTLEENGRRGTDHGSAAPVFLAGGRVTGGLVGPHPSLSQLENGGPKHHTDFRRVYATLLDRWLGFDSRAILGERFEALEVIRKA
jgi:uncharacterized protein (DUF1501 family)